MMLGAFKWLDVHILIIEEIGVGVPRSPNSCFFQASGGMHTSWAAYLRFFTATRIRATATSPRC